MSLLLNSTDVFKIIVDKYPDGIIVLGENSTIQYLNASAMDIIGRSEEELIGLPFGFSYSTDNKDEIDIVRRDGKQVVAEIRKTSTKLQGKHAEIISIRDITVRNRTEEELHLMKEFEVISILLGGLSHDFNNLLAIIMGNIELAMNNPISNDILHDDLSEALNATNEAKNLIMSFLQFTPKVKPNLTRTSIEFPLRIAVSEFYESYGKRCNMEIQSGLYPVMVDESLINKAFLNLFKNAYDAMEEGGTIQINVENVNINNDLLMPLFTITHGKYVKITIMDNGRGISKKNLQYIFDPYYSTKDRSCERGMGLGLSITYSIIKNHKGYVFAESKENMGTILTVYIPAVTNDK